MRSVLLLAYYTGWSRAELLNLEVDELIDWLEHIPKQ